MTSRHVQRARVDQTGRTVKKDDFHVRLYAWFMNTAAWRSLTPAERCVYLEIEARFFGNNNGQIGLSARSAAKACNISKDTAGKAFHTLVDRGFSECVTPGGFSTNSCRAPEWRLTRAPCNVTGARASKAFMKWRPEATAVPEASPNSRTVLSETEDSLRERAA
jgi:hypothetical protein